MNACPKSFSVLLLLLIAICASPVCAQDPPTATSLGATDLWQVPLSSNLTPHFEQANGRKILYVDGRPFTALAVEIPWWDLITGRYRETQGAYDYLYLAAEKIGLNAFKVQIMAPMVKQDKGAYDFSYVDHAYRMVEKHHLKLIQN